MIPVKVLLSLPWIGAAALMAKFVSAWDQLPVRVATHFGLSGEPNGWTNKGSVVGLMAFVALLVCGITIPIMLTDARKSDGAVNAAVLASAAIIGAFWEMIDYNATAQRFRMVRAMMPAVAAGVVLLFNYFTKPAA